MTKEAVTVHPVNQLIRKRWSARSFSEKQISQKDLNTLFEAAGWAASAGNEQPWEYIYAKKDTPGFDLLVSCLLPGNQPWAKHASILVVSIARQYFAGNGKSNMAAFHDTGMANAHLFLQATEMGLIAHAMGGFDRDQLTNALQIKVNEAIACVIALGYLGDPEQLEEPFKSRELAPRVRKPITEFIKQI
ncbi:MAG: nitroreductase family protein [bacterium]|nr:nitroreductase family protein [bacterium]